MEIYEPENLKLWQMPDYYAGTVWQATYVFLGQDRDSDALTRSNFISALAAIGGESETVNVVRESHWFCGWVEWIAIHQDDAKALQIADEIVGALKNYPVVDEEHFSALESEEAAAFWESMSVRKRAEYCARAGVSIYAARRDYVPSNDGALDAVLRGY